MSVVVDGRGEAGGQGRGVDGDRELAFGEIVEEVVAVGSGDGGLADIVSGVGISVGSEPHKGDRDAREADLRAFLDAVAVLVEEDGVADLAGRVTGVGEVLIQVARRADW